MSQRYRIVVQPEAQAAFEAAYQWIQERTPERAKAWANGFIQAIESLESFPARCPLAPESVFFDREIRQLLYGKRGHRYRILFTIEDSVVHILFVRHSAQDWLRPEGGAEEIEG
ncbi:MAG: type II toxin-antitoxin system RelE/ParE family toxin [Armatimonadota bacterium]|nr:type II toxin-antitoxin system RelE/ParE family toxin [Armatimonadota bacterium]